MIVAGRFVDMTGYRVDLTGQKIGKLTVVRRTRKNDRLHWVCRCKCGKVVIVASNHLTSNHTQSCGRGKCLPGYKHGHPRSGAYTSWMGMLQRCNRPDHSSWKNYGGRGIRVCKRWYEFKNFLADMGLRPAGSWIDRKDNDGNYTPRNCRWAAPGQGSHRKRAQRPLRGRGV